MIITLAEAKAHLNVTDDADDPVITSNIKAAEAYIGQFVDCDMTPTNAPEPMKAAVKMLVGTLYENRESGVVGLNGSVQDGPITVFDLIGPYRRWVF